MNGAVQQPVGFDGEVSGMSLIDLLQIKSMGRFTGRIVVEQGNKSGHLFFRDGDLVHAQLNAFEGKDAFARILAWGGGSFRAEPKVTTTRQTLHESFQFLLLDVLRMQDEIAAGIAKESAPSEEPHVKKEGGMKERLSGISGLQDVIFTDKSGKVLQSIGNNVESVAAQGGYLVSTSTQISDELGLGDFKGAIIQGTSGHIIALEGAKNYLFVGLNGEAKVATAEAEIRQALSNKG